MLRFCSTLKLVGIFKSSCLRTAYASICAYSIFSLVYDDMQGHYSDQEMGMNAWWDFCQNKHPALSPDDCSKRGAFRGVSRQKHMLWQFTQSDSMHAKIKWYATAREPSQWKQNQGISMFQLCLNQGCLWSLVFMSLSGIGDRQSKKATSVWILDGF